MTVIRLPKLPTMTYRMIGRRFIEITGVRIDLEIVKQLETKYRVIMRVS